MAYIPPLNGGRLNASLAGTNTAGVSTLISTGTMYLAGGNNITLSQNGASITISGANAPSGSINFSAGGNSANLSAVTFANSNGMSFGLNGSVITASAAAGLAISGGGTSYNNGTVNLSAAGGALTIASAAGSALNFSVPQTSSLSATGALSISTTGGTINIGVPAQTNQTLGLYAAGGTLNNTTLTADARSLSFSGMGNVSVGYSNGMVQISGSNGGGGVALQAGGGTFSSGSLSLNAAGGLSINSGAGPNLTFAAPTVTSLVGVNGITLSSSSNSISIGGSALGGTTLSRWEYPEDIFAALGPLGQSSLSIQHMYVPFNVSGASMKLGGSMQVGTAAGALVGTANFSLWVGIYTLTGSTLALASSGSTVNSMTWQGASASTAAQLTGVTGMRQLTAPMTVNMTPGEYWMAALVRSATTNLNATFSIYGNNQIPTAASGAILAPIGSNISLGRDVQLFDGIHATTNLTAGPTTIIGTQINNLSASNVQRANFYNVIYNAIY